MHSILNYRYTDLKTWHNLEKNMPEILLLDFSLDVIKNNISIQETIAVIISYHIHKLVDDSKSPIEKGDLMLDTLLELESEPFYPIILYFKAKLSFLRKKYDESDNYFVKAKKSVEEVVNPTIFRNILKCIGSITDNDPNHIEKDVLKAIVSNDTGNLFAESGFYSRAIKHFKYAYEIQCSTYKSEHANIAYTLYNMGNVYKRQNNLELAKQTYELALKHAEKVYGSDNHEEINRIRLCIKT